jgi:hypothetical protein
MGICVSGLGNESARSIGKALLWQNLLLRENGAEGGLGRLTIRQRGQIGYRKI